MRLLDVVYLNTASSDPARSKTLDACRNQAFKKNDVLPPWIESRKQHTAALETLHTSLAAMLHRRLLVHPDLPRFASLGQIERLRVREVEQGGSEHAFWFDMVKDVNSKGRSADGIGPPSTRKG